MTQGRMVTPESAQMQLTGMSRAVLRPNFPQWLKIITHPTQNRIGSLPSRPSPSNSIDFLGFHSQQCCELILWPFLWQSYNPIIDATRKTSLIGVFLQHFLLGAPEDAWHEVLITPFKIWGLELLHSATKVFSYSPQVNLSLCRKAV